MRRGVPRRIAQLDTLAAELADHALALARAATQAAAAQQSVRLTIGGRREARDRFIYDLLVSSGADNPDLLRHAEIMGMDLTRPRAVILLDSGGTCTRQEAESLISRIVQFFLLPRDTICGYLGAGEVVVLKAANSGDLEAWARPTDRAISTGVSWANLPALKRAATELAVQLTRDRAQPLAIGVGRYHPGLRGLGYSYRDARAALSVGRLYQPGRTVYSLDEMGLGAWAGAVDEATRLDLAHRLIGPLEGAPELLETLDVFFAVSCSPSLAAARLAIHRNTLTYRLDRVLRLTGLDPRRFDDAVQLRLALLLRVRACANAQESPRRVQEVLGT